MSSLVAFHIGPVQGFIAAARRTQDLWIGSWLLSFLTREAIAEFVSLDPSASLVAPSAPPKELSAVADTPNHFVIELEHEDASEIANKVETEVRARFDKIAWIVRERFLSAPRACVSDDLWRRQIASALEVFWVTLPATSTSRRDIAYSALAARKMLRDFDASVEPGLKCSQCGLRQELSALTDRVSARKWWRSLLESGKGQGLRVRPDGNERLCAVCFVKRAAIGAEALPGLCREHGAFPSTSSVASAHWVADVLAFNDTAARLNDYIECLDLLGIKASATLARAVPRLGMDHASKAALQYDGDLFYAETLATDRLKDEYPDSNMILAADAADQLRQVYSACKKHRLPRGQPDRYYAVLAMDGDHMGAFFAKADDEQARSMSAAVATFAHTIAIEIVDSHYGRAVYAGGDDLLALLPMADALPCADELATRFRLAVEGISMPEGVALPSVSVGIALAHHTSPFQVAIEAARMAESSAKKRYNRAAVCVHVLKRSGEEVRVGTRFGLVTTDTATAIRPLQIVARSIEMLRSGDLAGKFPTALIEDARGLSGSVVPLASEARKSRVCWIARRHASDNAKADAMELGSSLCQWADSLRASIPTLGIEEVSIWMGVARFIANGGSDQ